jgi:aryl-alcohol dehydrogenase-like predicted oxidoreductase
MNYNNLGRTGLRVSELCLGSMQFGWTADEDLSYEILNAAFEAGINFIDTADIYSRWVDGNPGGIAETIIGKWIKKYNIPRDQVVIATKVRGRMGDGPNDEGLSRGHIMQAVEASLRRLNTEYIDLYQTHWYDASTPVEETLSTLSDLVHQGKVRYLGCSNYPAWRLMEAIWTARSQDLIGYDTLQPHYSLVNRAEFERDLEEVCRSYELGVLPYSPLGGGFLSGKYRNGNLPESKRSGGVQKYFNDRNWDLLDSIMKIGAERGGLSASQVSLAWLFSNPRVTSPIIGPRTIEQLQDNLGAVGLQLLPDELKILDQASDWKG